MLYLECLDHVTLFNALHAVDVELAEKHRAGRCQIPGCGGPLHRANYTRKPRGEAIGLPDTFRKRLSFCCGWCRRRSLPASCLFFGRRVYWGAIVLLVTAARQGRQTRSIAELCREFRVSRKTVRRWVRFFESVFPKSSQWVRLRGRVVASVRDALLPFSLLELFARDRPGEAGLVACIRFLATGLSAVESHGK